MESLTLTTPLSAASVIVSRLILDWDGAAIWIVLRLSDGQRLQYDYSGAEATALMRTLNKANLTIKSLHRLILEKLKADHPELAGVISGAPDA